VLPQLVGFFCPGRGVVGGCAARTGHPSLLPQGPMELLPMQPYLLGNRLLVLLCQNSGRLILS
jgi:hypothetical protein